MKATDTTGTLLPGIDGLHVWGRHARRAMEAIAESGSHARAVIVGNAGSGKSTMLRALQIILEGRGTACSILTDGDDLAQTSRSHVLLVDDLHLLDPERVEAVRRRAEDMDAALIVAGRTWPQSETLNAIILHLERSRPPVVLGHISRSDILTSLEERGQPASEACVDHIVEFTGGVSWLVSEALALHDERECVTDSDHRDVVRALEERIAHRLETVPVELRREIELRSLTPLAQPTSDRDLLVAQGYAEGLLMRNGQPVPVVRSAVRATTAMTHALGLDAKATEGLALSAAAGDHTYREWIGGIADPKLGQALIIQADRALERDPRRAGELYAGALECGVNPIELAGRRAQAAWASGELELASSILDGVSLLDQISDGDRVADTAAAIWSARGMMRMSDAVYRSLAPVGAESCARATIAALGVGDTAAFGAPGAGVGLPSTLSVAMELLDRGLRTSMQPDGGEAAVTDLVRASEMYTASRTTAPVPELPAVIAAIVAINVGDLEIAHTAIEDAITGDQGGEYARQRLLLWRAWMAVQRGRPTEAREALRAALEGSPLRGARDTMLAHATRVAIARRYEDSAALSAVWTAARDSVVRTEADLYTILPLAEIVAAAARLDDTGRVLPHFTRAVEIVDQLGSPPVWAAHLHWSGIQQGILRNQPDDLAPHARALVAATRHSAVAGVMAQAGRVWTSTLAGSVDPDAVEAAAHGLASAGLAWDGARLAGHGASRSADKKVASRLLSCARELHPNDGVRPPARSADESAPSDIAADDGAYGLSERELDVARLVLQGKTYAEIGQTIFISPRTAEHHIAHIRRRLGATSRSDLIAKLRIVVEHSRGRGDQAPHHGDRLENPLRNLRGIGGTPDARTDKEKNNGN